jgi:hypothetical protein
VDTSFNRGYTSRNLVSVVKGGIRCHFLIRAADIRAGTPERSN